jgi:hypothetical protein
MTTSSNDERKLRGILFDEDTKVALVEPGGDDGDFYDSPVCKKIDRALDRIMHAMNDDSDALKSMRRLLESYEGYHYPNFDPDHLPKDVLIRVVINNVLLAVCGWSLPTLLADEFPGDEAKDEGGHGEKLDG